MPMTKLDPEKSVDWGTDETTPEKNPPKVCPDCRILLNSSGECPVCNCLPD